MNDPFATLGVPRRFTLAPTDLEQRHRDLSRALHPDRYVHAPAGERRMALDRAVAVNDAYRCLRDPMTRTAALLDLHHVPLTDTDKASPALLMDVMELRESLDAARAHASRVASLRASVDARIAGEEAVLARVFDRDTAPSAGELSEARDAAMKLRYFRRFLDEADALEG